MKFLITGGDGYVGRALRHKLIIEGHQVDTVDVKGKPTYTVDISVTGEIERIIRSNDYDGIFHLAAITSPGSAARDPIAAVRINILGTEKIFEAARDVKRVVFASSSAIYTDKPNIYSATKRAGEEIAKCYDNVVALRYFNIYGPDESVKGEDRSVITKFMEAAIAGHDIVIFGDGSQSRDFIYIDDVVSKTLYAMRSAKVNPVMDVGTGTSNNFNAIAHLIKTYLHSRSNIVYVPNPMPNYQAYTKAPVYDCDCVPLAEGIRRMIL
jgi:UDP-glucose 4-epimerase